MEGDLLYCCKKVVFSLFIKNFVVIVHNKAYLCSLFEPLCYDVLSCHPKCLHGNLMGHITLLNKKAMICGISCSM